MGTLRISDEVAQVLVAAGPVVALESTLITHGLPAPTNLIVAQRIERAVREAGAVPATIAVLDGTPWIGLSDGQWGALAGPNAASKAGSRDLAPLVAAGGSASTTVGATCVLAEQAGIEVFATGGIGGVHRGAAETFDESADLLDLARTGRVVVSSGMKSVLDVSATLERLETLGVPVLGYCTDQVPGFWTVATPHALDHRVNSPDEVVDVMVARESLGLSSRTLLIMRPVDPDDSLDPAVHDTAIEDALAAAEHEGIRGSAVTPYILKSVHDATQGASVHANTSLIIGNAVLAAQIAVARSARRRPPSA